MNADLELCPAKRAQDRPRPGWEEAAWVEPREAVGRPDVLSLWPLRPRTMRTEVRVTREWP